MTIPTRKVFISHASEDKERFVLNFAKKLREQGVDAWVDVWEMLPGDSIVDKIFSEGIRDAYAMIVILSKNSVEKRWVREELNAGFMHRINGKCKVIPVVIDPCEIPEALRSTIWEEIRDLDNYDDEFQRILDAIFSRNSKPPLGPPSALVQRQLIRDYLANSHGKISSDKFNYEPTDLEGFILDKFEAPTLRLEGLQLYLTFESVSRSVIGSLIFDPDFNIRRTILRYIHNKATPELLSLIDKDTFEILLSEQEDEVSEVFLRLAGKLVENNLIPLELLTRVSNHRYFLIRKLAIEIITKIKKPESLNLLFEFSTTNYHVSQRIIRDYIEQSFDEFNENQKNLSITLLEKLNLAEGISEKTRENNLKLLEKLKVNMIELR
jgi:hypothetical protein